MIMRLYSAALPALQILTVVFGIRCARVTGLSQVMHMPSLGAWSIIKKG